jgi:hypothetical protein
MLRADSAAVVVPVPDRLAQFVITGGAGTAGPWPLLADQDGGPELHPDKGPALFLVYQTPLGVHCRKLLTAGLL